jgi:hypothetical protein
MRMVFGVLGLLIVVAIVGMVAKNQLTSMSRPSASTSASGTGVAAPVGTPKQQVDQVRQSVESALQKPRPDADETK